MTNDKEMIQRIHTTYLEYNKTIRAWFVGYGVGAPVILLTQEHILKKFSASDEARFICILFAIGIAFQLLTSIFNKWMNWIRYNKMIGSNTFPGWAETVADKLRNILWLNVIFDLLTAAILSTATVKTFSVVIGI